MRSNPPTGFLSSSDTPRTHRGAAGHPLRSHEYEAVPSLNETVRDPERSAQILSPRLTALPKRRGAPSFFQTPMMPKTLPSFSEGGRVAATSSAANATRTAIDAVN